MCKLLIALGLIVISSSCASESVKKEAKETYAETRHTVKIDGQDVAYKALAGNIILNEKDDKSASFFFVYYKRENDDEGSMRPIAFCTNGGPGSSSIWLHMGLLGPRRVLLDENGKAYPPYELVDNCYSLLNQVDLVFIDPVSTGFSTPVNGTDAKKYHGVEEDINSVADFIQLFLSRYNRWDSPKYFIGESYGTTRAAGLSGTLLDKRRIYLNGIILISSILNFQTHRFDPGNDLPYQLILPTYTASAWYHGKLPPDLQKDLRLALKEAEQFAMNEYALALLKGSRLTPQERRQISTKLARLTGLSTKYIEQSNLRVPILRFAKELLRDERRTIGRFDSRYLGIDGDIVSESIENDPSADAIFGAYTSTFNAYVRDELKWSRDDSYEVLANVWPWNFNGATNKYLNQAETLRETMTRNPSLKVFVASGTYDLATPYFATDYTIDHLGLDPALRNHVRVEYYDGGHMMYTHMPALMKLSKDLGEFIQQTKSVAGHGGQDPRSIRG